MINYTTGYVNYRLTLMEPARAANNKPGWRCRCQCGCEKIVASSNLPKTKSCGCWNKEQASARFRRHGATKTPEYITWSNMISRCECPNRKDWGHYGGRGIAVCREWRCSFESFLRDMGPRPFPKATLDRIDHNGNYEPSNCRWTTQKSQNRNKRTNFNITIGNQTKTIGEWSEISGLDQRLIRERILRGWPPEMCLSEPRSKRWRTRKGDVLVDSGAV